MAKVTFIEASGKQHEVTAQEGQSVMQVAMDNLVPGIVAECGGFANCATCHGYVDDAWLKKIPPPDAAEEGMIECAFHVQPNSRLTCQIKVTPALDGLVVRLPVSQTGE
ncbi:2Fe-2S iron-sulfur cluster binding domain-containing protein [Archangium violaceum]|uniref:2Fe-2S iron-sulfur cluster-binding protein n=1 Tax=Archangium violaceum TaxID=83451 RepID=UPI00195020D3|nr:2Fe-2S iron-sulfur cluster-binding protein [Archangium violaceum]QRO01958.1 2Fe-2S iron-sulfur cluster binding domain-containing protein [Archangium violaceum]